MTTEKSYPAIAHVEPLFDIVGKTVDNVTYSPTQYNDKAQFRIDFTDGTYIHIIAATEFTSVTDGKR